MNVPQAMEAVSTTVTTLLVPMSASVEMATHSLAITRTAEVNTLKLTYVHILYW